MPRSTALILSENSQASSRTAHVDSFCREHMPPAELLPDLDWSGFPALAARRRLNCATELLDQRVASGDDKRTVFHSESGPWSYGRLLETANRIGRVLVEDMGLVPGNRVLLHGPNTAMLAACWFAVLKAGGIVVCTTAMLRARELSEILRKAEVNICVTDACAAAECEQAVELHRPKPCRVLHFNSEQLQSLEALLRTKPDDFQNCDTAADDVAIIAFTSGTTGTHKGAMHFHRDLVVVAECFPRHAVKAEADDIFCGSPPLSFTFGLGALVLFPMRVGASAVLLEQGSPSRLLEAIPKFRATICFTSPTGYRAMLPQVGKHDISSLRKCVSAGETLPAGTFEAWRKATGLKIIDGLGSTEMLHIFISAPEEEVRPGSTGKVLPGYQAIIVDNDGKDMPPGEIGQLAVRGPTGCRYLDDLEHQQQYVRNGWNLTGDLYRVDLDGYFWYQSRTDDMITSSGYNISGVEVENVLLGHPKIAECAVIGVPHPERGTIVKAFVVLRPGIVPGSEVAKELQDFVKSQIAPYKYPRAVKFMESLPRTATGKLQRYRLREES